jgi:DNA (cytosine-5)-methyltransferase 1
MKHLDLFTGIGGFALAAQKVWGDEYEPVAFCDDDYFCQQTLQKNFPGVPIYGDIRTITNTSSDRWERRGSATETEKGHSQESGHAWKLEGRFEGSCLELITGGFPCQPFSQAGRRKGTEDDRYLWPEMFRVIREFQPKWVIAENVRGLTTWNEGMVLETVCADLESQGYEVWPVIIPAVAVGAPHRRERVWIVAHSKNQRAESRMGLERQSIEKAAKPGDKNSYAQDPISKRSGWWSKNSRQILGSEISEAQDEGSSWPDWGRSWQEVAFATCHDRVDDGLPKRVARLPDGNTISEARWRREALKSYGNAIVPQVAVEIMRAIKEVETIDPPSKE